MTAPSALIALPERHASQTTYTRASLSFDTASFLHTHAREVLLSRLEYLKVGPEVVVDLGCAVGGAFSDLCATWPEAAILGIDLNIAMCRVAKERARDLTAVQRRAELVVADAEHLPLDERSVDAIFANFVLPWCLPERVFAEAARVLAPDGILLFATVGPQTLAEVRRAWARVDDLIHVHAGFDVHDIGDLAARAGLSEPVLDVDRLTLSYPDVASLVRDLRAAGATNTAPGRRKTLTGRNRWRRFEAALEETTATERLEVSVELIFGQAFGRRVQRPRPRSATAAVPLSEIKRRR